LLASPVLRRSALGVDRCSSRTETNHHARTHRHHDQGWRIIIDDHLGRGLTPESSAQPGPFIRAIMRRASGRGVDGWFPETSRGDPLLVGVRGLVSAGERTTVLVF
jgi:hypothetical protein